MRAHSAQGQRPGLAGRGAAAGRGRVREGRVEAFGGVEAGREQPVGPGEGEDPAQHPQGVGDIGLGEPGGG